MEAVQYYSDLDVCHSYMVKIKWPDGVVTCPKCGAANVGYIASRRMMQCKSQECRKQFSAKVGTIFEDSPLGLDKWFVAVWSITNCKNGVSSCELARALGVTQKTAWFMLHRVRLAMKTKSFARMGGKGSIIESDETFVGGLAKNMHKKRRETVIQGNNRNAKTIVHGLLERGGHVRAAVVPDTGKLTLMGRIRQNVAPGTEIHTDELMAYRQMADEYTHKMIDHAIAYVDGKVHTNSMENFWSTLKRALKGTYIHTSPEHLFRYLDEQVLRFNERKGTDATRFAAVMPNVVGRRIMYTELIGTTPDLS
jgi:transposase-like protein